jgi:hypothetical protein
VPWSWTGFSGNTLWDWLHLLLLPLLIPAVVAPALTSIATAGMLGPEAGKPSEPTQIADEPEPGADEPEPGADEPEPGADDAEPAEPVQPEPGKQAGSYP